MATKKLGNLIKEARVNAGLTQEKLAKQIDNLSASDLSKAERGEKDLTQDQLKAIAKATGVTQKSLLDAAGSSSSKTSSSKTSSSKTASSKKTTSSGTSMKVNTTEKKIIELYRSADSDTKKKVLSLLKGESSETGTILNSLLESAIEQFVKK